MANKMGKLFTLSVLFSMIGTASSCVANAQQVTPIEVEIENLLVRDGIKTVYLGNDTEHFVLDCKVDAVGCITPKKYKKYWLVDEHTNWTRPGAKTPLKLAVIQDFTSIYDQGVNYGLVAEDLAEKDALGMYILDPDQGG